MGNQTHTLLCPDDGRISSRKKQRLVCKNRERRPTRHHQSSFLQPSFCPTDQNIQCHLCPHTARLRHQPAGHLCVSPVTLGTEHTTLTARVTVPTRPPDNPRLPRCSQRCPLFLRRPCLSPSSPIVTRLSLSGFIPRRKTSNSNFSIYQVRVKLGSFLLCSEVWFPHL